MRQCIFTIFALLPSLVWAQDYNLYETIYLTPLPGHGNELERALGQHNREFHSEAPHAQSGLKKTPRLSISDAHLIGRYLSAMR